MSLKCVFCIFQDLKFVSEQQTQAGSVVIFWQNYDFVEHAEYNVEQQRRG